MTDDQSQEGTAMTEVSGATGPTSFEAAKDIVEKARGRECTDEEVWEAFRQGAPAHVVAQAWEGWWWKRSTANATNTWDEERKQKIYADYMGLKIDFGGHGWINLQGKSVLDIGGGPTSLLLRTINAGRRKVVDPLEFQEWVYKRYDAAGIEYERIKGEDIEETGWDEVWIYNVLEHVEDPTLLLEKARAAGTVLRIFEWTKTGVGINHGHIHEFTEDWFRERLPHGGNEYKIEKPPEGPGTAFAGVYGEKIEPPPARPILMDGVRIHMPGLAHTALNEKFVTCAYTQKVIKLSKMLTDLGYDVRVYGAEGADVECTEFVQLVTAAHRRQFYAGNDNMMKQYDFNTADEFHGNFNSAAIQKITKRLTGKDILLCAWGWGHKPIADALVAAAQKENRPAPFVVESGIGYPHTFADFRVFESNAWMSYVWGLEQGIREHRPTNCPSCNMSIPDSGVTADARRRYGIHFYDVVIPNFFDPDDFRFQEEKEDWILYIGRMVDCKGIQLAVEATKFAGVPLKLAGQGTLTLDTGAVLRGNHIEFVGFADTEKRKDLMARAKAVIVPTKYVAPFEGVNVEAQMSGTPVITTDQGAFVETVQHAKTGYRCHTMEQFVWACQNVDRLSPKVCRDWAVANYSMDRVAKMYDEYLHMLAGIWHLPEGWGVPNVGRTEFDWQKKEYPQ